MLCCFPLLFHTYTCSHCMCQVTVCLNHLCLSRWDTLISIFAVDIVIGLLVAVFFFLWGDSERLKDTHCHHYRYLPTVPLIPLFLNNMFVGYRFL